MVAVEMADGGVWGPYSEAVAVAEDDLQIVEQIRLSRDLYVMLHI